MRHSNRGVSAMEVDLVGNTQRTYANQTGYLQTMIMDGKLMVHALRASRLTS